MNIHIERLNELKKAIEAHIDSAEECIKILKTKEYRWKPIKRVKALSYWIGWRDACRRSLLMIELHMERYISEDDMAIEKSIRENLTE